MFRYLKDVRDIERLRSYLAANGFMSEGIARQGGWVCIQPAEGEEKNPDALIMSYANKDYYVITSDRPVQGYVLDVQPRYNILRDGKDIITFTITKKSGVDNKTLPHNDSVDIHWHGTKAIYVSSTKITLTNGVGSVEIGKVYMPGGGFVEVVHPTEAVDRGTAWINFTSC